MPKPRHDSESPAVRHAPNTIVIWFDGMTERRGRVIRNLPGVGGRVGSCQVRDVNGVNYTIKTDKLFVAAGGR